MNRRNTFLIILLVVLLGCGVFYLGNPLKMVEGHGGSSGGGSHGGGSRGSGGYRGHSGRHSRGHGGYSRGFYGNYRGGSTGGDYWWWYPDWGCWRNNGYWNPYCRYYSKVPVIVEEVE